MFFLAYIYFETHTKIHMYMSKPSGAGNIITETHLESLAAYNTKNRAAASSLMLRNHLLRKEYGS